MKRLRAALSGLLARLWEAKADLVVLLGIGLVGAGGWLLSPPWALITMGVILLWVALPARPGFFVERRSAKGDR